MKNREKLVKNILKLIFGLAVACNASAATVNHTGKVTDIRVFSKNYSTYNVNDTGMAVIYVEGLAGACGTAERRIAITTDHPLYHSVLSVALAAKMAQSDVEVVYIDSCTQRQSAWDFAVLRLK